MCIRDRTALVTQLFLWNDPAETQTVRMAGGRTTTNTPLTNCTIQCHDNVQDGLNIYNFGDTIVRSLMVRFNLLTCELFDFWPLTVCDKCLQTAHDTRVTVYIQRHVQYMTHRKADSFSYRYMTSCLTQLTYLLTCIQLHCQTYAL